MADWRTVKIPSRTADEILALIEGGHIRTTSLNSFVTRAVENALDATIDRIVAVQKLSDKPEGEEAPPQLAAESSTTSSAAP